jgi:putative oxidoreductase
MLVARLFLGLPVPIFGVMKFLNQGRMGDYIESAGIPGEVIWIVIPLQLLCGIAVWVGFQTRWAAFLLGGFCVVAASLYHNNLADAGELASFTKDFATAGGYLFLWKFGPGRYSLDAWLRPRSTRSRGGTGA